MMSANTVLGASEKESVTSKKHSIKRGRGTPSLLPLDIGKTSSVANFVDSVVAQRTRAELILSEENSTLLADLMSEHTLSDRYRRHGLRSRNRLLFCGPPGCGKTITAEVIANELGLDLVVVRIDALISSFLGETASNIRTVVEAAERKPCVLFFDEFDALARTRADGSLNGELRRVVNSLLMLVEGFSGRGFLIAATNLDDTIDEALWRRFDEVILFDLPNASEIKDFLAVKTRNFKASFAVSRQSSKLVGYSFAELDSVCSQSMKYAISDGRKTFSKVDFDRSLANIKRRQEVKARLSQSGI